MHRNPAVGAYVLTEIKSGTSAKPEHTFDLAFQRVVLEAAGFPIARCEVAHVNRDYVRNGEINPQELVSITDITDAVTEQLEKTRTRIDQALSVVASGTMPDPSPERARLKSYGEWLEIREKLDPPLAQDSKHFPNTALRNHVLPVSTISMVDRNQPEADLQNPTLQFSCCGQVRPRTAKVSASLATEL